MSEITFLSDINYDYSIDYKDPNYNIPNKYVWDKKSYDCKTWIEYYDEIALEKDPNMIGYIKDIVNNIDYITFEKFLQELYICVDKFLKNIKKDETYLFIVEDNKSSLWVFSLIEKLLNYDNIYLYITSSINTLYTSYITPDNIVLIDDCIYSGEQISRYISSIFNDLLSPINFHIIVPFITNKGLIRINKTIIKNGIYNTSHIYYNYIVNTIKEKNIISKYYILNNLKYSSNINKPIIFFEHKIADHVSLPTFFFNYEYDSIFKHYAPINNNPCIPYDINKNIIYKQNDFIQKFLNNTTFNKNNILLSYYVLKSLDNKNILTPIKKLPKIIKKSRTSKAKSKSKTTKSKTTKSKTRKSRARKSKTRKSKTRKSKITKNKKLKK